MYAEIMMPKMSSNMESGKILEIVVADGKKVSKDDVLFQIETDKTTAELTAPSDGLFFLNPSIRCDDEVPVKKIIGYVADTREEIPSFDTDSAAEDNSEESVCDVGMPEAIGQDASTPRRISEKVTKVLATPVARKLAKLHAVDLRDISGSGPGGRIRRTDIEDHISVSRSSQKVADQSGTVNADIIEFSTIRAISNKRISQSWNEAPHIYLETPMDMDKVLRFKNTVDPQLKLDKGYRLSITSIIVKQVAECLARFPELRAKYVQSGLQVQQDINIGVAVATDKGLVVPVIKKVDGKTLAQVNDELRDLVAAARKGICPIEALSDGICTVSNLGIYDIKSFTSVLVPEQATILSVGAIMDTPVVKDGAVCVRPVMQVTLGMDHRCADGSTGAKFLSMLKKVMEDF